MKLKSYLLMALLLMGTMLMFSACVVTSDTPVFFASETVEMPDISGAFTNKDDETFLLEKVEGYTNAFTLIAPDKSMMGLVFEPLKTKGNYVVQVANPVGPPVMLALVSLAHQGSLEIYGINPKTGPDLAKKHGITLDDKGKITNKPTVEQLKDYFEASFGEKFSTKLQTIGPEPKSNNAKPESKSGEAGAKK